jgi:hypothetical protein
MQNRVAAGEADRGKLDVETGRNYTDTVAVGTSKNAVS